MDDTEVIVVTGHGDMELSIEALRLDASDFISKPVVIPRHRTPPAFRGKGHGET